MTVQELIDVLSQLDPGSEVTLWDPDMDFKVPIDEIEIDQDGDVVIY